MYESLTPALPSIFQNLLRVKFLFPKSLEIFHDLNLFKMLEKTFLLDFQSPTKKRKKKLQTSSYSFLNWSVRAMNEWLWHWLVCACYCCSSTCTPGSQIKVFLLHIFHVTQFMCCCAFFKYFSAWHYRVMQL